MGFNMTFLIGPEAHQVFFKATDEELSPREAYQMVVPVFGPGVVYDCPTSVMYEQLKFVKSGLVLGQLRKVCFYVPTLILSIQFIPLFSYTDISLYPSLLLKPRHTLSNGDNQENLICWST